NHRHVPLGNDDDVDGGARVDVTNGKDSVLIVEPVRWNATRRHLAKQAILRHAGLLDPQPVRNLLAMIVAVAPEQLASLLPAEVELNLIVLREADAAVNLLALRHDTPRGIAAP